MVILGHYFPPRPSKGLESPCRTSLVASRFSGFFHEDTKRELLEANAGHPERQRAVLDMAEPGYQVLARADGPRFIKTHLPFSLLPKDLLTCGAKVNQ